MNGATDAETERGPSEKEESVTLDRVLGDKVGGQHRSESVLGDRVKATPSPPVVPPKYELYY